MPYREVGPRPGENIDKYNKEKREREEAKKAAMSPPTLGAPENEIYNKLFKGSDLRNIPLYFETVDEKDRYKKNISKNSKNDTVDIERINSIPVLSSHEVEEAKDILSEAIKTKSQKIVSKAQADYLIHYVQSGLKNEDYTEARKALADLIATKPNKLEQQSDIEPSQLTKAQKNEAETILNNALKYDVIEANRLFQKARKKNARNETIGKEFTISPKQKLHLENLIEKDKQELVKIRTSNPKDNYGIFALENKIKKSKNTLSKMSVDANKASELEENFKITEEQFKYLEKLINSEKGRFDHHDKEKLLKTLNDIYIIYEEARENEKISDASELEMTDTADTMRAEIPKKTTKKVADMQELDIHETSAIEELMESLNTKQETFSEKEYEERLIIIRQLERALKSKEAQEDDYEKLELSTDDFSILKKQLSSLDQETRKEINLSELFKIVDITKNKILRVINADGIEKIKKFIDEIVSKQKIEETSFLAINEAIDSLQTSFESRINNIDIFKREEVSPSQFEFLKNCVSSLSKNTDEDITHKVLHALLRINKKLKDKIITEDINQVHRKVDENAESTTVFRKPLEKSTKNTTPKDNKEEMIKQTIYELKDKKAEPPNKVQQTAPHQVTEIHSSTNKPSQEETSKSQPKTNLGELKVQGETENVQVDEGYKKQLKILQRIAEKRSRESKTKTTKNTDEGYKRVLEAIRAKRKPPQEGITEDDREEENTLVIPKELIEKKPKSWLRRIFSRKKEEEIDYNISGEENTPKLKNTTSEKSTSSTEYVSKTKTQKSLWSRFVGLFGRNK